MSGVRDVIVLFLAASGLFFMLVAAIGIVRLPDLYTRMHAAQPSSRSGDHSSSA